MNTTAHCVECGKELPANIPKGLCPTCALAEALEKPAPVGETPGAQIGRYKLLQQIGEGGCGVVFMAEQQEPIRRKVALKVIKLGMDTRSVIARFEAERQALALMDHPNIAKVLDAGTTDTGRPYFVMELVRGVKITDYCDQQKLTTRARLDLFAQVCHAIQHAHQKGIIHRDIKPSNILVTLHDGEPVPKVIDFGIAKATSDQRLTDKTLFTAFEQFMGTPAYMSPEQAEMSGLEIDTRSDIYSLGVLLYELLTGQTPFDAKELLAIGFEEMRRTIREKEPAKPSTRLSTMADADLTIVASHRQTEPNKLAPLLRDDLDWIVMKALEKDRRRRYETAGDFSQDIERHLAEQPVSARAPSAGYRLGKFMGRNRVSLSVGSIVAILAIALAGSTFLLTKTLRAARYAGITVNSNPADAEVWRDGRKVGTTPFNLENLRGGHFTYSLVLSNYETVTNTTFITPGKQMNDFTFLRRADQAGPGIVPPSNTNLMEVTATAPRGAVILSMEGKVEFARGDSGGWTPAQTNTIVFFGDGVRTGVKSRATLRLSDLSTLRINELTHMEIRPPRSTNEPPSVRLTNGTINMFRRSGGSNVIQTPLGRAQIRG